MRNSLIIFVVSLVAAIAAATGPGAGVAKACSWNIGCEFYSPSEGHSATQFTTYTGWETVESAWNTYTNFMWFSSTAGGSWTYSWVDQLPVNGFSFQMYANNDKVGCYNHHTGTMFVNCKHHE